jgi:hypothetical protein
LRRPEAAWGHWLKRAAEEDRSLASYFSRLIEADADKKK